MWEENLKPKKLTVRVGRHKIVNNEGVSEVAVERTNSLRGISGNNESRRHNMHCHFRRVESEEKGAFGPNRTIKLEKIGFVETLPCPVTEGQGQNLFCRVDSKGETRILIVSDSSDTTGEDEKNYFCIPLKSCLDK